MQYITYDEYVEIGGTLDLTAFNRKITRVCGIIENATYGRIEPLRGIPTQVKELCRDLVELLAEYEEPEGTVQSRSQSAGGVSESVSFANVTNDDIRCRIDNMITDYLSCVKTKNGVSLLYKGAMS